MQQNAELCAIARALLQDPTKRSVVIRPEWVKTILSVCPTKNEFMDHYSEWVELFTTHLPKENMTIGRIRQRVRGYLGRVTRRVYRDAKTQEVSDSSSLSSISDPEDTTTTADVVQTSQPSETSAATLAPSTEQPSTPPLSAFPLVFTRESSVTDPPALVSEKSSTPPPLSVAGEEASSLSPRTINTMRLYGREKIWCAKLITLFSMYSSLQNVLGRSIRNYKCKYNDRSIHQIELHPDMIAKVNEKATSVTFFCKENVHETGEPFHMKYLTFMYMYKLPFIMNVSIQEFPNIVFQVKNDEHHILLMNACKDTMFLFYPGMLECIGFKSTSWIDVWNPKDMVQSTINVTIPLSNHQS